MQFGFFLKKLYYIICKNLTFFYFQDGDMEKHSQWAPIKLEKIVVKEL